MVNSNHTKDIEGFLHEYYLPRMERALRGTVQSTRNAFDVAASQLRWHLEELGRPRIFAFGNGGSEAIAEAFRVSLERMVSGAYDFDTLGMRNERIRGPVTDDTPWDLLHRKGRKGDLAFLVSASGNSQNIYVASQEAKRRGVKSILLSQGGRIVQAPTARPNYPIVVREPDQQIAEDAMLGAAYLLVSAIAPFSGQKHSIWDSGSVAKELHGQLSTYCRELREGLDQIKSDSIDALAQEIVRAYHKGKTIRIDAPDSHLLGLNAQHMVHNLKWDAFTDIKERLPNRVYTGLPSPHISGVSNDGGNSYNLAIELEDNCAPGDVEVVFATDPSSPPAQRLLGVAYRKGASVHSFSFPGCEYVQSNVVQTLLHATSRVVNTYLREAEGTIRPQEFRKQLESDLALLRQKERIRAELVRRYDRA